MSLRLIKPGMGSANLTGMRHPKTGLLIEPLYIRADGSVVWPALGAGPNDPDDPDFIGGDDEEDDEEDEEDDKKKPSKKSSKKSKDDDEEDDDEEDEKPTRPERQAARYRTQLREAQKQNADLAARLKAIEDKDKKPDEIVSRDLEEARSKADKLAERNRAQTLELAFFKANQVEWEDPSDALKLVDLDDVDVDEDGTVDPVQLRKALRALAKAKPHLVKKPKASGSDSDDDEEDEDEPRSPRSGSRMNGRRKGSGDVSTRDQLAKKFPVLGRGTH